MVELLEEADGRLRSDPDAPVLDLVQRLSEEDDRREFLTHLAGLALSVGNWTVARSQGILSRFRSEGLPEGDIPTALGIAYSNRVYSETAFAWMEVESFGYPPDELKLRFRSERGYLGMVIQGSLRLDARLGAGGVGVVYSATEVGTGKRFAVKLPTAPGVGSQIWPEFLLEKEIADAIGHDQVPRIHAIVEDPEGNPALVMELVDGESLQKKLKRGPLDSVAAAKLALAIARPLKAARDKGFHHRDLSPANILIDIDSRTFLTDWNIARSTSELEAEEGKYSGTAAFSSIESISAQASKVDERSDLWSLGAILYESLTCDRVLDAGNREEALVQSLLLQTEMLAFPDSVPDGLRSICNKSLQRDRSQRYQTIEEFEDALNQFLGSKSSERQPGSPVRELQAFQLGLLIGSTLTDATAFNDSLPNGQDSDLPPSDPRYGRFQAGIAHLLTGKDQLRESNSILESLGIPKKEIQFDWTPMGHIYKPKPLSTADVVKLRGYAEVTSASLTLLDFQIASHLPTPGEGAAYALGRAINHPLPPIPREAFFSRCEQFDLSEEMIASAYPQMVQAEGNILELPLPEGLGKWIESWLRRRASPP